MPLLRAVAELISDNEHESGIIEEIILKDDLFAVMPFKRINGKAYVYNREDTFPRPQWISPVTDTVPEDAATFTEEVAKLHVLAGQVDVDKFLDGTMSDLNGQWELQMQMQIKGMATTFRENTILGDNAVNPKEPSGLPALVDPAMVLTGPSANGDVINYALMDELEDMVANGVDAFMMNRKMLRSFKEMVRQSGGGNHSAMLMLENFGAPVMTHDGIPIIVNDIIPDDEVKGASTNCTSIYALRLNEVDGFHGIYGGPGAGGIVIEDIGTLETKDATRTRIKWYVGYALKSTKSLARLSGILV